MTNQHRDINELDLPGTTTSLPTQTIDFDLVARSVTHELRQSLSLIIGYTELLGSDELTPGERAALLLETRRAARRLGASLERLEQSESLTLRSLGPAGEHQVLDLRPGS